MADTAAKLGEALGDDLRMGEICLRALARERQNGRGKCCPERCGSTAAMWVPSNRARVWAGRSSYPRACTAISPWRRQASDSA
jgi:hypothetical protein